MFQPFAAMHRRRIGRAALACLLLIAAWLPQAAKPAVAQSPPAADAAASNTPSSADSAAAAESAPEPIVHRNLFSILRDGGLMMVPLFACSFILLVFVFEKAISLRRGRVVPAPFVKRFLPQLRDGKLDRDQALELCQESKSPVADIFAGAVKKWGRPAVEVEQALIDAGERTAHRLRRYLRLFNAIATISPLLGLLGTVFGMMHLFNAIATSDAMGRTELLAGGISEALMTTASGLGVAVPAMCFYLLFLSRVDQLLVEMDGLGQELCELISAEGLERSKSARTPSAPRPDDEEPPRGQFRRPARKPGLHTIVTSEVDTERWPHAVQDIIARRDAEPEPHVDDRRIVSLDHLFHAGHAVYRR